MKHSRMQKANVRAFETPEQTLSRQETDKVCKTRKRASETSEQSMKRQETDKVRNFVTFEKSKVAGNQYFDGEVCDGTKIN